MGRPDVRPSPADLQPWVLDLAAKYQQGMFKARPTYQCRPAGLEADSFEGWKRIIQTPAAIVILANATAELLLAWADPRVAA